MIDTSIFYPNFYRLSQLPLFKIYLRWSYSRCVKDLSKLKHEANFQRPNFTCLLSGCASPVTASEFITFILKRNPKANIIILDIGQEQTEAIKQLVKMKYPNQNIVIKRGDILNGDNLLRNSVDWIETDAVLGYFTEGDLQQVLTNWKDWLKKDGFITMREAATSNLVGKTIDLIKIKLARKYFGSLLYRHSKQNLEEAFKQEGFRFVSGITPVPSLRRYTLVKD